MQISPRDTRTGAFGWLRVSSGLWFWRTLVGGLGVVGAAYAPVLLIPEALVVAVVADGLEPLTGRWQGWRRGVDWTRVGMFLGWYVVALLGLSILSLVIDNRIVF